MFQAWPTVLRECSLTPQLGEWGRLPTPAAACLPLCLYHLPSGDCSRESLTTTRTEKTNTTIGKSAREGRVSPYTFVGDQVICQAKWTPCSLCWYSISNIIAFIACFNWQAGKCIFIYPLLYKLQPSMCLELYLLFNFFLVSRIHRSLYMVCFLLIIIHSIKDNSSLCKSCSISDIIQYQ